MSYDKRRGYDMSHMCRGSALIFNNTKFHKITNMGERTGSDDDAVKLFQMVENLSFDTRIFHNTTSREMLRIIEQGMLISCNE